MAFLRNTWCVAAWDDEVAAGRMMACRLLNEPVVLLRNADGAVQALLAAARIASPLIGNRCSDPTYSG